MIFISEHRWQALDASLLVCMPASLKPWLTQAYILTKHLKAVGSWSLQLLQQGWVDDNTWQRKIVHKVDDQNCVLASVDMPKTTYQKLNHHLGGLAENPIGEKLLYYNDAVRRSAFEYVQLTAEEKITLAQRFGVKVGERAVWARRSTFYWHEYPLTITEYFFDSLPAFPNIPFLKKASSYMRSKIIDYIHLTRLHRPIPILLMMWPTLWALWIASDGVPSWRLLIIFILGVVVMRSAGDVLNDLADRNLDGYIERTRMRPLATGRISVKHALVFVAVLLCVALGLVLMLNTLSLYLAFGGLALAIAYPFMKRVTYLPQVVLGCAYNWGIIMAFGAVQNQVPAVAWLLWLGALFWTLAYDTEYALADRKDDVKTGIKSTAVLFGRFAQVWIAVFQGLTLVTLALTGYWLQFNVYYFLGLLLWIPFFVYQHSLLPGEHIKNCIKAFNHNHWLGLLLFLVIMLQLPFK